MNYCRKICDCKAFLTCTCAKLLEKCPLKFPAVRFLRCLDPRAILKWNFITSSQTTTYIRTLFSPSWQCREDKIIHLRKANSYRRTITDVQQEADELHVLMETLTKKPKHLILAENISHVRWCLYLYWRCTFVGEVPCHVIMLCSHYVQIQ